MAVLFIVFLIFGYRSAVLSKKHYVWAISVAAVSYFAATNRAEIIATRNGYKYEYSIFMTIGAVFYVTAILLLGLLSGMYIRRLRQK